MTIVLFRYHGLLTVISNPSMILFFACSRMSVLAFFIHLIMSHTRMSCMRILLEGSFSNSFCNRSMRFSLRFLLYWTLFECCVTQAAWIVVKFQLTDHLESSRANSISSHLKMEHGHALDSKVLLPWTRYPLLCQRWALLYLPYTALVA